MSGPALRWTPATVWLWAASAQAVRWAARDALAIGGRIACGRCRLGGVGGL